MRTWLPLVSELEQLPAEEALRLLVSEAPGESDR